MNLAKQTATASPTGRAVLIIVTRTQRRSRPGAVLQALNAMCNLPDCSKACSIEIEPISPCLVCGILVSFASALRSQVEFYLNKSRLATANRHVSFMSYVCMSSRTSLSTDSGHPDMVLR
jgi:hypothetical protein